MKRDLVINAYILTRLFIKRIEAAFEENGLDIQSEHYLILRLLKENGEQLQIDLSRDTIKGKTFITRAVFALEERKLLKRRIHKDDGRAKLVSLTKKGEKFLEKSDDLVSGVQKTIYSGVLKKDQKAVVKILRGCIKNID